MYWDAEIAELLEGTIYRPRKLYRRVEKSDNLTRGPATKPAQAQTSVKDDEKEGNEDSDIDWTPTKPQAKRRKLRKKTKAPTSAPTVQAETASLPSLDPFDETDKLPVHRSAPHPVFRPLLPLTSPTAAALADLNPPSLLPYKPLPSLPPPAEPLSPPPPSGMDIGPVGREDAEGGNLMPGPAVPLSLSLPPGPPTIPVPPSSRGLLSSFIIALDPCS